MMTIINQFDFYTLLGFIGMLTLVIAYYNNLAGKVSTQSFQYALWNLIGAIFLLISLLKHFNLGSFLIEIFWVIISVMGIIKCKQGRHRHTNDASKQVASQQPKEIN